MRSTRIFIAGNGPSLRELDFEDLRGTDWLGMNAAYRHWDKIGIYPTIYSCLDGVVVRSHAREILRLHAERKVEKFFLVKDILEEIPDFPCDERVFFLEDVTKLTTPEAAIFGAAMRDKITTGSWAVRFAIYLGYREIHLGGIDASYVEVIEQARPTGVGLELKIDREVKENPNYFFSDYQKPGDVYQVPNPESHFGNLHLQSFEALNVDIQRIGLDVAIYNTARGSQLHRFGVYPYLPVKEALRGPSLQCIAMPLTAPEHVQLVKNLQLWDKPAFFPLRPDSPLNGRIALHLFFDGHRDDAIVATIEAAWHATRNVKHMFSGLDITFLGIPAELNEYIRDATRDDVPRKTGPNLQFLSIMRRCRPYRYTQLLETDCVPAKSDWITDLDALCTRTGPFWIGGAFLPDLAKVFTWLALHLNGNAIYATGDPDFVRFLDETFVPALRYLVLDKREFHLAYDCLIARILAYKTSISLVHPAMRRDLELDRHFEVIQANLDKFRFQSAILNSSHVDARRSDEEMFAILDTDRVLVHSRRLSTMVADVALASDGALVPDALPRPLQRRLKDTFIKVRRHRNHLFHNYANLESARLLRVDRTGGEALVEFDDEAFGTGNPDLGVYLIARMNQPTANRRLRCNVRLLSDVPQAFLLRFAREGAGPFIEDRRPRVEVVPGEPTDLTLAFEPTVDYRTVRLMLHPLDGRAGRLKVCLNVELEHDDELVAPRVVVHEGHADLVPLFDTFRWAMGSDGRAVAPERAGTSPGPLSPVRPAAGSAPGSPPLHYVHSAHSSIEGVKPAEVDMWRGIAVATIAQEAFGEVENDRCLYVFAHVHEPTAGRRIRADITLSADAAQAYRVRLARNGGGPYAETKRDRVDLVPGVPTSFPLLLDAGVDYDGVRVMLHPIEGAPGVLTTTMRVSVVGDPPAAGSTAVAAPAAPATRAVAAVAPPSASPSPSPRPAPAPAPAPTVAAPTRPRLLIVDSTPVGRLGSATGQLKSVLLEGWPESDMLQVWEAPGPALRLITRSQTMEESRAKALDPEDVMSRCVAFGADVVYVRPTESLPLLRFAAAYLEKTGLPAVVHVMDDWPERLRFVDPAAWPEADRLLRAIIGRSVVRLGIGDAMAREYERRYGGSWSAIANGVDPAAYASTLTPRAAATPDKPFVVRYMGGLATDMNDRSVADVARAVASLQQRVPIRLEIHTMPWYRERALAEMGALPGVRILDLVPPEQYVQTLCSADVLLLAYNFDPASLRYIGLSLANKMPECLASGVPLFAYGPPDVATIRYLQEAGVAEMAVTRDETALAATLEALVLDVGKRRALVQKARRHALESLDLARIRARFQRLLTDAARRPAAVPTAATDGDFRRANAMFREGRYAQAMALYVELHRRRPLGIYRDNAVSCGLKLGLPEPETLSKLTGPAPGAA